MYNRILWRGLGLRTSELILVMVWGEGDWFGGKFLWFLVVGPDDGGEMANA